MKKFILLCIVCMFYKTYTEQFVYPVADFNDGSNLILLYQKSLHDIELWIWNSSNHHAIKGLSSFVTPANLRMLPSGHGFSFIDDGYIKIKEFAKRSPKTLPIYEPIGLFSNMNWIDDETFYFVAREGEFFQIFQGDTQANIHRLTNGSCDALYPCKFNSQLFYIQRNENNTTNIVMQSWNPQIMNSEDFIEKNSIIHKSSQPLCFLHMVSEQEGFYLQAPTQKLKNDDHTCYDFFCYHLQLHENTWQSKQLFTFKIPARYITGSARLYESIEPFLPNYTNKDVVYFVDWGYEAEQFELYKFSLSDKNIEMISEQYKHRNRHQQIFAPYITQDAIIHCGLILQDKETSRSFRNNFENSTDVIFELPYFLSK